MPYAPDFVLQALSFESMAAITREDRRSDTTAPYWIAKLFSVLEGVQDGTVLSGRVWVDEAFWPVAPRDAAPGPGGRRARGLSRNHVCIGVGVDDSGRALLVREGLGKPSRSATWAAFGGRIERGSTLVHDLYPSHSVLVERLGLASEAHNAGLLKDVPDRLNPLDPVNRACFVLKLLLRARGLRRGPPAGIPRPGVGGAEPARRQAGEGRPRPGPGNALPKNAGIQGFLQREYQVRGVRH